MTVHVISSFEPDANNRFGPSSLLCATLECLAEQGIPHRLHKVELPRNYLACKLYQLGFLPRRPAIAAGPDDVYLIYPYWCITDVPTAARSRCIVIAPDLQSLLFGRLASRARGLRSLALRLASAATRRIERTLMPQAKKVLFVGANDALTYFVNANPGNGEYVPHPLTRQAMQLVGQAPSPGDDDAREERAPLIVFSGAAGSRYFGTFAAEILAQAAQSERLRDAPILLLGRDKHELFTRFRPLLSGLRYLDWIEDYGSIFVEHRVVQAIPLVAGSGTKNRLLEAVARGAAVVTTSVGAENCDELVGSGAVSVSDDPGIFCRLLEERLDRANDPAHGSSARHLQRRNERFQSTVKALLGSPATAESGRRPQGSGS